MNDVRSVEVEPQEPAEIQAHIEHTRASLDRKLNELQHRLNPRVQFDRIKEEIRERPVAGWAAVGAVAAGTWMAISGLRHRRRTATNAVADVDCGCEAVDVYLD
ncbi:MAG TPA: DUF3618 domain-containing protein [Vicinamibacterales bacterium]|nr:DUF3618 domain-containing protein [Vicinamibacterales bacterium]